jgi:hypothetical protein
MFLSRLPGRLLAIPLLFALLAAPAFAGTNEGFTASILDNAEVKDPAVGDPIEIAIQIENSTQAKGGQIIGEYDADFIEFVSFTGGPLSPGMIPLTLPPALGDDGITTIQAGGTQFSGIPGSGDGVLGTMAFKVIAEPPAEGIFISIVSVQIQASSSDKDIKTYEVGSFGRAVTRTVLYTLSGTITESAQGAAVEGAAVVATATDADAEIADYRIKTKADGKYSLEMPAGTYRLFVRRPDADETLPLVTHVDGKIALEADKELDVVIKILGTLSGNVADTQDNVIEGAVVRATFGRSTALEQTYKTESDADGNYLLKIPQGTYQISALPPQGTQLKPVLVQGSVAVAPEAIQDIAFVVDLANKLFGLRVTERRFNSALVIWNSRFPSIENMVRYRLQGETEWQEVSPRLPVALAAILNKIRGLEDGKKFDTLDFRLLGPGIQLLMQSDLTTEAFTAFLTAVLTGPRLAVPDLTADTAYELQAKSISLGDQPSTWFPTDPIVFKTRSAPDTRPVKIAALDIQPGLNLVKFSWETTRQANARVQIAKIDAEGVIGDAVVDVSADEDGSLVHTILVKDLDPATRYSATVTSAGIGLEDLISEEDPLPSGKMAKEDAADEKIRPFGTKKKAKALRFKRRPKPIVSSEEAVINVRLNQPALLKIHYGPTAIFVAKITAATQATVGSNTALYTDSVSVAEEATEHDITITGLYPSTPYRYKITAYLPSEEEGEAPTVIYNSATQISTDPRGNRQWSRDFWFRTSALEDIFAPEITHGPQVKPRARYATLRWRTDVPTTGTVYYGTTGTDGTLGTPDEFEVQDLSRSNKLRSRKGHRVVIRGLEKGTAYGFRIEATATNGQSIIWDPLGSVSPAVAAAKGAKLLQPPGGGGSFVSDLTPDTQFPVILSGPRIAAKTHDTAIIEWTTDEPANSAVSFGTGELDDELSSGDNEASHKLTLTNLTPGTTYSYIVGSTDAGGNGSTESAQAVFTTNPEIDLTAPKITSDPEVVYKNDQSATIQWTTNEETSGEVEFGPTEELGFVRTLLESGTTQEITLTNLTADTEYYYKVSTTDLSNNGPTESTIASFTTDATADLTPPTISDIVTTPGNVSVIVSWKTDELADSFVEFGADSSQSLEFSIGDVEDVLSHELTLTNLTADTKYYYRVGSVDRANNPPGESEIASFTTNANADITPPSVPFDIAAKSSNKQVQLSWDAQLEFDLGGFNVYRKATGEETFTKIASGLETTRFTDLVVVNETTYEYQITAIDRQNPPNESDPTAAVEAMPTSSAAPTTPANLTRAGDNYLRPTFIFTNATPFVAEAILTYTIQVSTEEDFGNVTASISGLAEGSGETDPGQTAWATIDRDLTENQTYYWRVRAVEGDLTGPYSDAEQFVARAPVVLQGDFNGDNAVTFDDFFLFVDAFGKEATGDFVIYDLSGNGMVDFDDFFLFVDNFGKSVPGKLWSATQSIDENAIITLEALGGGREDQGIVTLRIRAEQIEQLKAFGLVLRYDHRAVEWREASPGPGHLLDSKGGQAPLFQVMKQTPGQLVIGNGLTAGEPISGSGLLAELTFRVIGSANTHFNLTEALVASSGTQVKRVQQLRSAVLLPQAFHLSANYPNPFNPSTSIEFALPQAGPVELNVYDVLGQRVRTLVGEADHAAGFYTAIWDGLDSNRRPVGSGIYFYRLQASNFTRTYKMTLLK